MCRILLFEVSNKFSPQQQFDESLRVAIDSRSGERDTFCETMAFVGLSLEDTAVSE